MVLLSHFHSLSSFVFSCGLTQKLDGLSSPKLKTPPATVPSPQIPNQVLPGSGAIGGGGGGDLNALMLQQQYAVNAGNAAVAVAAAGVGASSGGGSGATMSHPQVQQCHQPQKTVLSEITLNNNNNNNNSMDHHSHQIYCNNNGSVVGGGGGANIVVGSTVAGSATGGIIGGGGGGVGGSVTGVLASSVATAANGVNKINGKSDGHHLSFETIWSKSLANDSRHSIQNSFCSFFGSDKLSVRSLQHFIGKNLMMY